MTAKMPKATHSGVWNITMNDEEEISVKCYVMNNGERVLSLRGSAKSIGLSGGGSGALVRTLNAKWISQYLSEGLREWLYLAGRNQLPEYQSDRGIKFTPFEASLFVDLCKAYVDASRDGKLPSHSHEHTANRMYAIMTAFAKTGLIAVIDEVTGYQDDRDRNELQTILSHYISEELLPWTKRFPDEFYKQMFRLKGWDYKGKAKPGYAGTLTNEYIYKYLPGGVLEELKNKTPKNSSGNKVNRYHQHLSEKTGIPHLDKHLQQTIALMKASDDWEEFDKLFHKALGDPIQIELQVN